MENDHQQLLLCFKQSRLSDRIPEAFLLQLLPYTHLRRYDQGEEILNEGKTQSDIHFLIKGRVAIYSKGELILKLNRKGDIFGEMNVLTGQAATITAIAETRECLICRLDKSILTAAEEKDRNYLGFELHKLLVAGLTDKLKQTIAKARKNEILNRHLLDSKKSLKKALQQSKAARTELESSEERIKALFSNAADAMFIHTIEGRIANANQEACNQLGYSLAAFKHLTMNQICPQDLAPELERRFLTLREVRKTIFETEHLHRSGKRIPVEINAQVIEIDNKSFVFSVARDISVRKEMEAELREVNNHLVEQTTKAKELMLQAEVANATKSQFLANMSHEIRTPMNGIIGMSELLVETDLDDEQRELTETIRSSAGALLTVINDILDYSKIEAGKLDLEIIEFDLKETVEKAVDLLAIKAEEKNLDLNCLVDVEIPTILKGDPGRIRQILLNLLNNGLKFTNAGEIFIRVSLVEETEIDVLVKLEVIDSGIGIPKEKMDRLFKTFSQVDVSTTRKFGGTGLGLAISKQLSEMMGGSIGVESIESKGSTFWFTARLVKSEKGKKEPFVNIGALKRKSILVVDRCRTTQHVLEHYLTGAGFQVATSDDLKDDFELSLAGMPKTGRFDLIMISMPILKEQVKKLAISMGKAAVILGSPTLLLTTKNGRNDAKYLLERGFIGYMVKPIKQQDLYQKVLNGIGLLIDSKHKVERNHVIRLTMTAEERKNVRILLAEDNAINQKVATRVLNKLGFYCNIANNGREAVEKLQQESYDLVLMDCQMPEMDGFEATEMIRAQEQTLGKHIPIIAMTANAMQGDRERCLKSGMDDYVSKPIDRDKLVAAIENQLVK